MIVDGCVSPSFPSPSSHEEVASLLHGAPKEGGKFRLGTGKSFFLEKVVGQWNRRAREMVMALSLPEFKNALRVWTMLSDIGFKYWVILCGARSWTQ